MKKLILKLNLTFLLVLIIFFSAVSIADENDVEKLQQKLEQVQEAREHDEQIILVQKNLEKIHEQAAKAYQQAYNIVLDEKWKDAIKALEEVERQYSKSDWADDARFWMCYSKEKIGEKFEDVFQDYQNFIERYPKSKWVNDAKKNMILLSTQLAAEGKERYETIIRDMQKSDEDEIVLSALYALQRMGDDEALPALIEIFDDIQNPLVRNRIVFMLSNFDSPEATEKLMDIARNDTNASIRGNAVLALGRNAWSNDFLTVLPGNDSVQSALMSIESWPGQREYSEEIIELFGEIVMNDPDDDVREKALMSLSQAQDDMGIPVLIRIAKEYPDKEIRKRAINYLGRSKDQRAREALIEIIKRGK